MELAGLKRDIDPHRRQIPWRYGGTQYSSLPTPQLPYSSGFDMPRLSVDTGYRYHQQVPPSAVGLPELSPMTYLSTHSFDHGSAYTPGNVHNGVPQASPSYENETARFQSEMEETMFGGQDFSHESASLPESSPDIVSQWQQKYSQSPDSNRKDSYCTTGSHTSGTVLDSGAQATGWHVEQAPPSPTWAASNDQVAQSDAMPIAHKVPFMPNHMIGSYGWNEWLSDSTLSGSSVSSEGVITSGGSHDYAASHEEYNYTVPDLAAQGKTRWAGEGYTVVDSNGNAQLHHQPQSFGGGQQFALPLRHTVPVFPAASTHQQFLGSPRLDDDASVAEKYWRRVQQQPVVSMRGSDDKLDKDDILLECRTRGMSYKDIKRVYSFTEAESTLRGRHRTLTKDKKDRVRKPEWKERDCRLLREAVVHFAGERKVRQLRSTEDLDRLSIPWKDVSTYIKNHGGSYQYGYSTTKKKYVRLLKQDLQMGMQRSHARPHAAHASA